MRFNSKFGSKYDLSMTFNNGSAVSKTETTKVKLVKVMPNLENSEILESFKRNVEIRLINCEEIRLGNNSSQDNIDSIYENIIVSIQQAHESLISYRKIQEKNNNWWSNELRDIKSKILAIKKNYKRLHYAELGESKCDEDLKELKKEFRREQRHNKRNKDQNKYEYVEKIAKGRIKKRFWSNKQ